MEALQANGEILLATLSLAQVIFTWLASRQGERVKATSNATIEYSSEDLKKLVHYSAEYYRTRQALRECEEQLERQE